VATLSRVNPLLHCIVVACGSEEGARTWLQETQSPFPLFLDTDRRLYQALGLKVSISQVWNISTICYYAEQSTAGRTLHKTVAGDDLHQMGGNLVLGPADARIRLLYRSAVPQDRPPLHAIHAAMDAQ